MSANNSMDSVAPKLRFIHSPAPLDNPALVERNPMTSSDGGDVWITKRARILVSAAFPMFHAVALNA